MTPHDVPYFVDNGAYTRSFDADAWLNTIERSLLEMPRRPDFFVLPDVYGDATATVDRHQKWLWDKPLPMRSGELARYWVLQPGLPLEYQFDALIGCQGVFLGGPRRWKRAVGAEVVALAREHDLQAHVGNPGGADGLVWAYRCGFDSCDTTSVFQNQYWHYLDRLERVTEETAVSPARDERQAVLADW